MATINFSVTIPDAQLARTIAGLGSYYGQVRENGGLRDMTQAELVEKIREGVVEQIKGIVLAEERKAAAPTAVDVT